MQKKNTKKTPPKVDTDTWQWNDDLLQWMFWLEIEKMWIPEHKPMPDWFLQDGCVSTRKFVCIWKQSTSINEVKKEIFWWSVQEIVDTWESINQMCVQQSIVKLPSLPLLQPEKQALALQTLLEEGLLEKETFHQEEQGYDPMKALLKAQQQKQETGRVQFQSMEVDGRYRFQAKH